MKIIDAIKSGALRSIKVWKGVLIFWFISILLVSLLTVPVKGNLKSGFGNSMITEKLAEGINVEVFGDMGSNMKALASSFFPGFFLLLLLWIIINAFITGGIFDTIKGNSERFSSNNFFRASSKYFWSFLIISLVLYLMVLILILLLVIVPASIISQADILHEGAVFKTLGITGTLFILVLSLIFVVADYSRAWQVSHEQSAVFRALGFGFRQTFRTFLSSYTLIIIMMILQGLFGWTAISIIIGMQPVTGGGVFILFLISQSLFFCRILLKVMRYGSVTSLLEQNSALEQLPVRNNVKIDYEI